MDGGKNGFLLEFTPDGIRGRNDTVWSVIGREWL